MLSQWSLGKSETVGATGLYILKFKVSVGDSMAYTYFYNISLVPL